MNCIQLLFKTAFKLVKLWSTSLHRYVSGISVKSTIRNLNDKHKDLVVVIDLYIFNCTQQEEGDLSFKKGEMLSIKQQRGDGWWEAENGNGKIGMVPSNYMKVR